MKTHTMVCKHCGHRHTFELKDNEEFIQTTIDCMVCGGEKTMEKEEQDQE
jgi:transcription elongation factor Elf1